MRFAFLLGVVGFGVLVGCSDDSSSSSSSSSGASETRSTFTCCVNGVYSKCPTAEDLRKCARTVNTEPHDCVVQKGEACPSN
jgi:hypothetical protein